MRVLRLAVGCVLVGLVLVAQAGEVRGRVPWKATAAWPIVVWIEGTKVDVAIIKQPVIVSQKNIQFNPPFTVVSRGQTVQFPNDDTVAHSVFSVSPAKPFQLGIFEEGARRSVIASRAGVVDVQCALHPQMAARLLVVDSAQYAVVQANGTFTIPNVPPGRQRIKAWHAEGAIAEMAVDVAPDGATMVSFPEK